MDGQIHVINKKSDNRFTLDDLREFFDLSEIGFWKVEIQEGKAVRMYVDTNMQSLIGLPDELSAEESYSFYLEHIHPDDRYMIQKYDTVLLDRDMVAEYRYDHPTAGEIRIRCRCKKISGKGDSIMIMGYEQKISDVLQLGSGTKREDELLKKNQFLEERQIQTNDYYKNLLDMMHCGVLAYTIPGHQILHLNAVALRIYGVNCLDQAQEAIGDILRSVVYPDADVPKKLKKLHYENGSVDYECTITNLKGESTEVVARTEVFNSPSKERCLVTTFLDVSENQALKSEKEILDALCADYTSVYICDLSKDSVVPVYPADILDEIFGTERMGEGIHSFSYRAKFAYDHLIVRESATDFLEKINAKFLMKYLQEHRRFVYRVRLKSNPYGRENYEIQVVRLNEGEGVKVILGFRYIDDVIREEERHRIALENALANSNRKNEIIGAIGKMFWQVLSVDLETDTYKEVFTDGKFTLENPRYEGKTNKDFLQAAYKFADPQYREQLEAFLDNATLKQRLAEIETTSIEYLTKFGFWVSAHYIVQTRNAQGQVAKVIFVLRQIDEQKKKELEYQKKLRKTAEEARLASESKTNFLRRMSHDIRTPLNGIIGLIKIDESHFDDEKLVRENHKKMNASAKYLLSLINDVLQMSKLEAGKSILSHEPIDMNQLSEDVVNIIIGRAVEAGITWNYTNAEKNSIYPYIYGSPVHLRQIFLNVYGNCIKYNHPGGSITTTVKCFAPENGVCTYRWIIQDTGIGMSKEFIEHIFDPFEQESQDVRTMSQGIGLGMAIVKGLLDQMGGSIEITSEEGVGSTFVITIPFQTADPSEIVEIKQSNKDITIAGLHLLLAEDNELNAEIAQTLLADEGACVTIAKNGKEAVTMFLEGNPGQFDAILMDLMMPVMDGLTATRQIRALDRKDAKTIPIIAMTANAFKEDERKCLEAGMNGHLSKPIEIGKIKEELGRYF